MIDLVLARKNPVGRISCSTASGSAAARSSGVGYAANSAGVVWLTRRSVVWADRTVATSSSKGLRKSSSGWAYGYTSASSRLIRRARRTMERWDSGLAGLVGRAGAVFAAFAGVAGAFLAAAFTGSAAFTAFLDAAFLATGFSATVFFAAFLAGAFARVPGVADAPGTGVGADAARLADFDSFAAFFGLVAGCSPTAESLPADTLVAPLACALTGELDTRPA